MSKEEMIYKDKLYKQLENNEEPYCEDYYLCEIEEKAKAYDELIDYLKECINFEKSGLLWTSKKRLQVYEEILNKIEKSDK